MTANTVPHPRGRAKEDVVHGEQAHAIDALPQSLGRLRTRFSELRAPAPADVQGTYRAVFVGPALLRAVAPRAIALGGMRGWHGKRFDGAGGAVNVLRDGDGTLRDSLPATISTDASWLDGSEALVVSYGTGPQGSAPVPWRWVRDEFRALDDGTLLGLTFVAGPWSRLAASPFALVRER
ncbi:hypothetical protein [Rhodococcus sp. BL-253-APC-6A1W]|uniref:hypothetical protein n=1 Tax=Rhodococcus sp. BL-253-APC-6A1W TaxID=2725307 RepID=UPI003211D915